MISLMKMVNRQFREWIIEGCDRVISLAILLICYYLMYLLISSVVLLFSFPFIYGLSLTGMIILFYYSRPIILEALSCWLKPVYVERHRLLLRVSTLLFRLQSIQALNDVLSPQLSSLLDVYNVRFHTQLIQDSHPYSFAIYSINGRLLGYLVISPFHTSFQLTSKEIQFIRNIIDEIRAPVENILLIETLQSQYEALRSSQVQLIEHEQTHAITEVREQHLREVTCLITGTIHTILSDIDNGLTQVRNSSDPLHMETYHALKEKCLQLCLSTKSFLQTELDRMDTQT